MSKVWFVTGASRGNGLAIARAALEAGDIVAASAPDSAKVGVALQDADMAERWIAVQLDVTDPAQAEAAMRTTIDRFGRIDVLVNNAGYGQVGFFETLSPEQIERQFAVNLFGVFNVTRAALPIMRAQRSGHFMNISSMGAVAGMGAAPAYTASKFALEGFSEDMARDLAPFGIHVTIIEPGSFRTDFLDNRSIRFGDVEVADYMERVTAQREDYAARSHRQPGDPAALGRALVEIADSPKPPLRLALGTDVVAKTREMLQRRAEELERWLDLSTSTDFEE